jgi:SAM-dependent methyltransferase
MKTAVASHRALPPQVAFASDVELPPDEYRAQAREGWGGAAAGWERRRAEMQAAAIPVSAWLVDHIEPQPGQTILELAAGPGDTGLMAAELVGPSGKLISTDASEEMLDVARRRAEELGIHNVEFKVVEGEWIDLKTATVDGVLCRWGYMLMLDPEAALRETRRVLRPGGRVALAAWAAAALNPHMTTARATLTELGLAEALPPGGPGPFAFAQSGRIEELLDAAGFDDVVVEELELRFRHPSRDEVFETFVDLSPTGSAVLRELSPADHTRFRDALDERLEPFMHDDGSVELPGRALVAAASA